MSVFGQGNRRKNQLDEPAVLKTKTGIISDNINDVGGYRVCSIIEDEIENMLKKYYRPERGFILTECDGEPPLKDSLYDLMNTLGLEFKIEEAIFARARFYAVAWIENNKLFLKKIEADAY